MNNPELIFAMSFTALWACNDKKGEVQEGGAEESAGGATEVSAVATEAEPEPELAVAPVEIPSEMDVLELDQDGNAIPATIEVPRGSTIFADEATTLRVSYGKGEAFGVQVTLGNEFNTNLKETAEMLREGGYGSTHEILEETSSLLRWKSSSNGHVSQSFDMLINLKGTTWVCKQGNRGGWNDDQIAAQIAACQTLKAR